MFFLLEVEEMVTSLKVMEVEAALLTSYRFIYIDFIQFNAMFGRFLLTPLIIFQFQLGGMATLVLVEVPPLWRFMEVT